MNYVQASPPAASHDLAEVSEVAASQAVKAQLRLREMILGGELPGGDRIAELVLVEKLGVSRTPIRSALLRLEQEGLLEALPGGGYAVRILSERDVSDAIELRGTLEGLAARLAAERGVAAGVLAQAGACLDQIDAVLQQPALDDAAFLQYVRLNQRFHLLLGAMAASAVLARELDGCQAPSRACRWGLADRLREARDCFGGAGRTPGAGRDHPAEGARASPSCAITHASPAQSARLRCGGRVRRCPVLG